MQLSCSTQVPGVTPDRARAWWWDLREGRADHRFAPGADRTVTPRGDGTVLVEDRIRGTPFRERSVVSRTEEGVALDGENTFARFTARYRFLDADDGTRIEMTASVEMRRGLARLDRLLAPLVRAFACFDLTLHGWEMARDLE